MLRFRVPGRDGQRPRNGLPVQAGCCPASPRRYLPACHSNPGSGTGTYGTLLSDIAGQVEYILADYLVSRGHDQKLAPLYAQMLVGMVAFAGQWWLDARKPKLEEVAASLINLAWNGLSQLDTRNGKDKRKN